MAGSDRDSKSRPVVVVTGMGVLTSLGAGQADNWGALTAGRSGLRRISRFPTEGLRTTVAGTVDFVPTEEATAAELTEKLAGMVIEEQGTLAGDPGSGARLHPGPHAFRLSDRLRIRDERARRVDRALP